MQGQTNFRLSATGHIDDLIDTAAGGANPQGIALAPGLVGQDFVCQTDADAIRFSTNQTNFPLYAGHYRYVQLASGVVPAFGDLMFYTAGSSSVVTNVYTGGLKFAGSWAGSVTMPSQSYGYIHRYVEGEDATFSFLTTTTKATPVVGDTIVVSGTAGKADVLADATAVTWATNKPIGRLRVVVTAGHLGRSTFGTEN